jgi:LmbE family N-acetylglucosaminyl deacetylase
MDLEGKRILAVGAHPDDVEFMCAGSLYLLCRLGYEIHVAVMSRGDCGSVDLSAQEISRIRDREARAACKVLGATYHCVGFRDLCIFNDDAANRRVAALLREVNPWLVITHPPQDYMTDHEMTSLLVRNACFSAPIPNYDLTPFTHAPRCSAIPTLYYAQPIEGIDLFGKPVLPQFYVDVSDCMDVKMQMLACHESQRNWLRAHHRMDEYTESLRCWNAKLGQRVSEVAGRQILYAEAFRQHLGHSYPHENLLAKILGVGVVPEPAYASRE